MNELTPLIDTLYRQAKQGEWPRVLDQWQAFPVLARRCSRYRKAGSNWGFLHQAAYFGREDASRELLRLGACLEARTHEGETPDAIATRRGHTALGEWLAQAAPKAGGHWKAPTDPDIHPASGHWHPCQTRRAEQGLLVGYGDSVVAIDAGQRYFVDAFERVLVGWHGTFDPPMDMGGWPLVNEDID
ncbi:hypothetical protein ACGLWX_03830 [Halomonas sp. HMF6819]|uniref:hypothetical protein n=1 Tax=Halomonas sp. HMF6819 TaxID=3373085 RepID=UPI0037BA52AF